MVVQIKNKTKKEDNFQHFETNHKNLFFTNESMTIKEHNFLRLNISETDLWDTKEDQLFVWDFRGMFENLKELELLNCHIEKLQRAMILSTQLNGNTHQVL